MIHVLAVCPDGSRDLAPPPSVEILRAHSADDAIEKLARNRRIDAVLFFDDATARETSELLAREGGVWPPLFQEGGSAAEGVTALDPRRLFDDLRTRLGE